MKLDRNIPENKGRGKYALLLLRNFDEAIRRDPSKYANYAERIPEALKLLEEVGMLDWGYAETESEFFLIRLKDKYAANALAAYADTARNDGEAEYAAEIDSLAARSGPQSQWCKRPD